MATLEELRVELDKIDNQMVELYQKRMNVCREVGDYKVKAGPGETCRCGIKG